MKPFSREILLGLAVLPDQNSSAVRAASPEMVGGKRSSWKASDLRGTWNEMGSISEVWSLKALVTSTWVTLTARLGMNAMPRWGSFDLYSER